MRQIASNSRLTGIARGRLEVALRDHAGGRDIGFDKINLSQL
jgi:hypothetical protein